MAGIEKIETFLLDLDGTFYLGDRLFPWSRPFVQKMEELGKRFIFVTNNSAQSSAFYVDKLARLGIEIGADQVFTSGQATVFYLKKYNYPRELYLLGTPALEGEFEAAGFVLTPRNPKTVVLGFDLTLTYEKLRIACDLIRSGASFIATHPDFNCPTPQGPIPDCGSMIALITASTGVKPKIIGKPQPEMVEALQAKYDLQAGHATAMVGDRLYTDIAMANAAGITGILVLSGETRRSDLKNSEFTPDHIFSDLGEITEKLGLPGEV